ncbi:MAG TPA: amidase [Pyrinomonadaceae bacterium]
MRPDNSDIVFQPASKLAELIRAHLISPLEVVEAHIRRLAHVNPALNAIVTLAPDALDRAREAEAMLMRGAEMGPLHGVPVSIKDTIDTAGLRTTSGSRIRENFVPKKDATVVARLKAAGAIILGKTNTPELAIPYETDNPVFGRTNNPYDLERTAGGSSGGEAAAIAACLSPAGIGSDLSGSIRVPAHFCGIVGLKPTGGRVPTDGHIPPVTGPFTLGACIGPMARTVADIRLLFGVIAEPTQFELSDHSRGTEKFSAGGALGGLNIAWHVNDGVAPVTEETSRAVKAVAEALGDAGAEVVESLPPCVSRGSRLWIELFSEPSIDQLREFYRGREDEAGSAAGALLAAKRKSPDDTMEILAAAMTERERLRGELLKWMERTPVIIAPVGSTQAFAHGTRRIDVGGQTLSVFRAFSYCQTYNVFGLPSVCVPAGRSLDGMPLGVQIIGRPYEEEVVLAVAAIVERELGGWQMPVLDKL